MSVTKPRLLDLFCGAGGCSVGFARAGFDVMGVDHRPQPNYPFRFFEGDALAVLRALVNGNSIGGGHYLRDFVAIHASPPCQHYAGSTAWRGDRSKHPDLIAPTRALLEQTGLRYVIENVPDARRHLIDPVLIDGAAVHLPIRRRRFFEANWPLEGPVSLSLAHERTYRFDHGATAPESEYRDAMGCGWMTVREARQAIPPAYTELIGHQLMCHLKASVAA